MRSIFVVLLLAVAAEAAYNNYSSYASKPQSYGNYEESYDNYPSKAQSYDSYKPSKQSYGRGYDNYAPKSSYESYEPEYNDYPSKPKYNDYQSKPKYNDYPSKPKYDDYPSKPKYDDYPSKPKYNDYPSKPKYDEYSSKPAYNDYGYNTPDASYPEPPSYGGGYEEPKSDYGYQPEAPSYGGGYDDDYQTPKPYGGHDDYAEPQKLISNGKGAVIDIIHTAWYCNFQNDRTYEAMNNAINRATIRQEFVDFGLKPVHILAPRFQEFVEILSRHEKPPQPLIKITIKNTADSSAFAVNENDIRNNNTLDNSVETDLRNKQVQDQASKSRQEAEQVQLGVVDGGNTHRNGRSVRSHSDYGQLSYANYDYCKREVELAFVQLSSKHEWLVDHAIEGYKLVGGYSNIPDSGLRIFNQELKAPVSTYGDHYGAIGYAMDSGHGHRGRRSYYAEKNAILTIWGWAKFCKPREYAKPRGYDRYSNRYAKRNATKNAKRNAYLGYDQECWKEGINVDFELDHPKRHYCYHKIQSIDLKKDNVLVGAVKYVKPSYSAPTYPTYPSQSYPSSNYLRQGYPTYRG